MTITQPPPVLAEEEPSLPPPRRTTMPKDDGAHDRPRRGEFIIFGIFMAAAVAALAWAVFAKTSNHAAVATPVDVTLTEYHVGFAQTTLAPGKYSFRITNGGQKEHELLVFQSELAPSAYPMKDGDIDEEGPGVNLLSDGDNIKPGHSQERTVDLSAPGTYLLVCNIPGHFRLGMVQQVTVR